MPHFSCSTLATGARQLVVQLALEMMCFAASYFLSLTPMTNIGVSSFDGADRITFLAPASRCFCAVTLSRNRPVDSITTSAFTSFHFSAAGSRSWVSRMVLPLTTKWPPSTLTSPLKRPCTES